LSAAPACTRRCREGGEPRQAYLKRGNVGKKNWRNQWREGKEAEGNLGGTTVSTGPGVSKKGRG